MWCKPSSSSSSTSSTSTSTAWSVYRSILPLISLVFLLLLSVLQTALCADDWRFEACGKKVQCGEGPNISYPFWISGQQESHCGFPGFQVTCKNQQPTLNLSTVNYVILDISYQNQTLRLIDAKVRTEGGCSSQVQNFTLDRTPFLYGPNHEDLFLFLNCNYSLFPSGFSDHEINCSSVHSMALLKDDLLLNQVKTSGYCDPPVITPVDGDSTGIAAVHGKSSYYTNLLKEGFDLKWNASHCTKCQSSGGRCGFNWTTYYSVCLCPDRPHLVRCSNFRFGSTLNLRKKLVIGSSFIVATILAAILAYFLRRKLSSNGLMSFWKKRTENTQNVEAFLRSYGSLAPKRYSYSDIKKITNLFKEKLGQGGYGGVFKGKLPNGRLVAVKILNASKGDGEEFINEVASISSTSHVNIVTLLGFCFNGSKRALIYEFMPNGSLEKFIYNKKSMKTYHHLSWERLYQIAVGIAQGLEYLHRGCNTRIVHFDIKPHNILLDEDFCPKISDFGLAKLCPAKDSIISMADRRGTIGYIAPEVFSRNFGEVSHKSDVYSYGMMILEMVGGRKNFDKGVDHTSEIYFPDWIYEHIGKSELLHLDMVMTEKEEEIVRKIIVVGLWCIQMDPTNRPPINKVVDMFRGNLESLPIPPKPYLSSPSRQLVDFLTRSTS
ncbi:LEAF RUST 10 DISEASE-RESISTANCE LOCUS RECEPTOR-LIKE PROTEIN KINASE-like 2.1 isoform X2 [Macadamia integrifolia]|nr:LEAF RUST 10 DISEASE-RESISTANCE LOCUS RECEPTOR-LIKE PROTEIN KINASE-like 2.1 isoform X2 [Macadamia integrifolia]